MVSQSRVFALISLPAVALMLVPGTASLAGIYDAWGSYMPLTIDNTNRSIAGGDSIDYTPTGGLTDFPVLVVLTPATTNNYAGFKANGEDLRFSIGNTTALDYEIEEWNAGGSSTVWVKVPSIPQNGTTNIVAYWNNPSASDGQNPDSVWSNSFLGVWHLKEAGGGSGEFKESSGAGPDGTGGSHTPDQIGGKIGKAQQFTRANGDYIDLGQSLNGSLDANDTFSVHMWFKIPDNGSGSMLTNADWSSPYAGMDVQTIGGKIRLDLNETGSTLLRVATANTTPYDDDAWHSLLITSDGTGNDANNDGITGIRIFVDGMLVSTATIYDTLGGNDALSSTTLQIGARDGANNVMNGLLDEVRLSRMVRSADWAAAMYLSESNAPGDPFVTFGTISVVVPEPSSFVLAVGLGLVGLIRFSRRRRCGRSREEIERVEE